MDTTTSVQRSREERTELERRSRSQRARADAARRTRMLLMLADGKPYTAIEAALGCSSATVALWKQRFVEGGLACLGARHQGTRATVLTPALEARILTWTRRKPPNGATHWSTRLLARKLGVSHTRSEFVAFLADLLDSQPPRRAIHVIADNLSAHKTPQVHAFLAAHPRVTMHYTPTYSSWRNQVELWFAKIERDVIARGIFTSVTDLARKLRRYIRQYNRTATPFRWFYADPTRRVRALSNS